MMKTKAPLLLLPVMPVRAMGWLSACGTQSDRASYGVRPDAMAEGTQPFAPPVTAAPMEPTDRGSTQQPLALAKPGDDIWIIVKPPKQEREPHAKRDDDHPGAGAMVAVIPPAVQDAEPKLVPMPLKHTEAQASVTG